MPIVPTDPLERLADSLAAQAPSKRMLMIVNPYATTVSDRLKNLVVYALRGSYQVDAIDTERRDHATELCREAGYTPASVALAWVLRNENVSSAIVGASRPEQIAENVKALDVVLEPDFVEAIEKVLEPTTLFDPGFTLSPTTRP